MTDYHSLLLERIAGKDRPTARATICLSPSLMSELSGASGDARAEIAAKVRAASVQVVMQALPEAEWKAYLASWKKLPEDDPRRGDDSKLIRLCFLRCEDMDGNALDLTVEQIAELLPHLSGGEATALGIAAVSANEQVPEVPSSALR